MARKMTVVVSVVVAALLLVAPVAAAGPAFGAGIWADGRQWGTKLTTYLPAPHGHNLQSFEGLYFFTLGDGGAVMYPDGSSQAPVAEAGPGNPAYNGGRWVFTHVTVTDPGAIGSQITSFAQLQAAAMAGYLTIDGPATDAGHLTPYFQCPLLPFKS